MTEAECSELVNGTYLGDGTLCDADCTDEVTFEDETLGAAVQAALGGCLLTPHNLQFLTNLDVNHQDVYSLSGLEYATELAVLNLDHCLNVSNLIPLSGLTKLVNLNLDTNRIVNIDSLSGLTLLTHLDLDTNEIVHVEPLTNLANLQWMQIHKNCLDVEALCTHIPVIKDNNPGLSLQTDPINCDCPCDVNNSGKCDVEDFLAILGGWGPCGKPFYGGDVDRNGTTDVIDFLALLAHWGQCP